jgi:hypothetical protein
MIPFRVFCVFCGEMDLNSFLVELVHWDSLSSCKRFLPVKFFPLTSERFTMGDMILITHPACTEYSQPGHPERPERIARTVDYLKQQDSLDLSWKNPGGWMRI